VQHAPAPTRLFTLTLPVLMGYFPLGIVFGFLFVQSGAAWWLAPLMSLIVFAGASQFLAIALLSAGVSLSEIAFACFVVNLRHIFYGISLIDLLPRNRVSKAYCISALTDENYSLITGIPQNEAKQKALAISALTHSYWVGSTLLGALIGQSITTDIVGLDFSLTALFTVLAVEQFRRTKNLMLPLLAVTAYIAAVQISATQPLFLAICISAALSPLMTSTGDPPSQPREPKLKEMEP
jgi:4-azaleucine resistance transporter AzlC